MEALLNSLTARGIVTDQTNLDLYWKFIHERHTIWYKRFILGQKAPWTEDKIMTEYKFTNVYRELDRGTIYLLDTIVGVGAPHEQVFNIIWYRMFNRIRTFELVGFQSLGKSEDKKKYVWTNRNNAFAAWRASMEQGVSLYTDAHMVCAYEHFPGKDKLARFEYILDGVVAGLPRLMSTIIHAKSLEEVWKALTKFPGIGPFLAYEMAVDITYASWNNLSEDEWVNAGPGCQRGLKFIFQGLKTADCPWMIKVLRQAQRKEFQRLGLHFPDIAYKGKELTLRNIEHCCCEAFKYFKATYGKGRPRNKFKPNARKGQPDFARLRGA